MASLEEMNNLWVSNAGRVNDCIFCGNDHEWVLFETEHYKLIRNRYQIAEWHLMIISKDHYACLGELPRQWNGELATLQRRIQKIFADEKYIAYEHGKAGHCVVMDGANTICEHFHIHFVPLSVDITGVLDKRFESVRASSIDEIQDLYYRYGEYLLFKPNGHEFHFYPADASIEPHYLATLIARQLGRPELGDWTAMAPRTWTEDDFLQFETIFES